MTTEYGKSCKDCLAELASGAINKLPKRVAKNPGPRCTTHWRAESRRRKADNHEKRVQQTYGLEKGEYAKLYIFQGGRCAICRRATGASKRLAVDHDHATGAVRGLACSVCNRMLGHARDKISFFRRCVLYLGYPPYKAMRDGWTNWYDEE